MFIAAQFTIPSTGSNLSAHQQMNGSKIRVHLQNGILHSREKKGTYTLCNSMDGRKVTFTTQHSRKTNECKFKSLLTKEGQPNSLLII